MDFGITFTHIKLNTKKPAVATINNIIISNFNAPKRSANLKQMEKKLVTKKYK